MLPMPFEKWTTYEGHSGVDFPQRKGTPIRASANGVVTEISYSDTGGWRVWVNYGKQGTLKYVHMDTRSDILVNVGDNVEYMQTIARVGMLGRSTGYHLHLENADQSGFDAVWWIVDRNNWLGKPNPIITMENGAMESVRINNNIYGIAPEFITHYGDMRQATITRNVYSVTDELHELGTGAEALANWVSLLDGSGIPRNVLDNQGRVLNPESGAYESNGTWSRERENRASNARIEAMLKQVVEK